MAGHEPKERPTRLILVRHGEAQCHVEQVVGGVKGCTGLSDLGRQQSAALRRRLERSGELDGAEVLYASTLPRAVETAEAIAPALGGPAIKQDEDLCELHPGEADGITWDEFRERYTWAGDATATAATIYRPMAPGAESWARFSERVGAALHRLADDHPGQTVVVACHGGVVQSAFHAFGQLPLVQPFLLHIENTSLTEWRRDPPERRWTLVRFNDAAHLTPLPELE